MTGAAKRTTSQRESKRLEQAESLALLDVQTPIDIATLSQALAVSERLSCLLYTSPSPRDRQKSRMPSSA